MQRWGTRGALWGVVLTVVLVMNVAWAPASAPAKGKLERLLHEIGGHKFNGFAGMPLFWLFCGSRRESQVHSRVHFPGSITGFFTSLEYIKLAHEDRSGVCSATF